MDWLTALESYARTVDPSNRSVLRGALHALRTPKLAVRGPNAATLDAYVNSPGQADPLALPEAAPVLALDGDGAIEAVLTLLLLPIGAPYYWRRNDRCRGMVSHLLRRQLPWTSPTVTTLALCSGVALGHLPTCLPHATLARVLETHGDSSERFRSALLDGMSAFEHTTDTAALRKLRSRLGRLANPGASPSLDLAHDPWGAALRLWYQALPTDQHAAWLTLFDHARSASSAPRPSKTWLKRTKTLIRPLSPAFPELLIQWMEAADLTPVGPQLPRDLTPGMSEHNRDLLKGLVFAAATQDHPTLPGALATFALDAYTKVPQHGAKSSKLGNAVVAALGAMPDAGGAAQLTRIANKVRYAQARRLVERALSNAAEAAGLSRAEVEQNTVPTLGLEQGPREVQLGDHTALLSLDGAGATLTWRKADGKVQRSVPKAVKDGHSTALAALRAERKELLAVVEAQRARIEGLWLSQWTADLETLRRHYLNHPVVGSVARRLLWEVDGVGALWLAGELCDLGGQPVCPSPDALVRLWHPLTADPQRQLIWRDRLDELGIRQPFQQIWRPVYRATEDSAYDSTRFAGRVMHQPRLVERCQKGGWRYQVQGMWDSLNDPERELPELGVRIVLGSVPFEESATATFRYVISGELTFTSAPDHGGPRLLSEIDPIVFSELMLQTDQLVSACAVHTLPDRLPDGIRPEDLLFPAPTPLTQMRASVLERALPRTQINATVDGSWLVVGAARIHLDTAAVQVAGRHTPHPPDKKHIQTAKRVFLPHEGDPGLRTVLAQAIALNSAETP